MRPLGYALVVVVCSFAVAFAAPKKAPKAPKADAKAQKGGKQPPGPKPVDKAMQDELAKLDKEYYEHSTKQAHFAAVKIAKKLYELQVKATGPDSLEAERRLQTLASAYSTAGDYSNAEKAYIQHIKLIEKRHGADSQEVLWGLMAFYSIYYMQARYDDLEPIFQRMLAINKKLHGEKSKEYAQQLTAYGGVLQARNSYSAAQRVYEQALQIYESVATSKDDHSLVSPLQMLAAMHWNANQYSKAIALYDRAIKIAENSKDMMFVLKVVTIWTIGIQYSFGGRKDLSGPLFKKAIALTETELARLEKTAPDDWQITSLIAQLGGMYRYNDDLAAAEQVYLKAIKLAEKKKMSSGMESSLAEIKRLQGKNKEALALYDKTATELAKYGPQHATAMNSIMADVARELGDYDRAEKLLDAHRPHVIKQWGKKHTTYGYLQLSSYNLYSAAGKLPKAEAALDDYLDVSERELSNVLRSGTDTDHALYFSKNIHVLDTALNYNLIYAPKSASATRLALTTLLRRKGRVLDAAAAALATIRAKLSPDDKKLLDELASARTQLAKLSVAGPAAIGDVGAYTKEVAALEDKILRLEAQISKKSAAYRTVTLPIELATIQKAIPKDGRLVELVNYQPYDPQTPYAKVFSKVVTPRRYAAFIVGTKGDPVLIELGEAAPIDQAIEKFRKALADPDNDQAADLGKSLYDLTMAKIIPKLGGSTNILIAPDGALNVIPFSALVDDKKQFLIKKYTFTYLTSGRDLLRVTAKTKAQGGGVLFADPKFDSTGPAPAGGNKTRGRRSADLASLQWPQLPGTAAEADAVVKTFKGLKVFRGDAATEGSLKLVKGPQILHLATHGFFLPDEKPPEDDAARGPAITAPPGMGGPTQAKTESYENPLLRSGLAFAGANKLVSGDEDGLLTALEASGLNLTGTKLVVLSACETGVGKVTNGDGVYGLRRSLVIAGAESLVMSLWQVDDFATKELMTGFYKNLAGGKARSEALRTIQLDLLSKPKYAHPFYWAAFLPAGATTPLKD